MSTELARRQMVEQQIRTWDVFDPGVLEVFGGVPRDLYVPEDCAHVAYADTEIPLPHDQCMLRPNIIGRLLQALHVNPGDEVLEIGTGTGYLTACLAEVARSVTSIDIFGDFVAAAKERLADNRIENVLLHCMDAMSELPNGKFDAIAVTGSIAELDERFIDALKVGGRLFVVVGESPAMHALLVTRTNDGREVKELFETDIPALVSAETRAVFSF
jgi:protein-L-isoaspartate(D-aspartate) O-methyltransferase